MSGQKLWIVDEPHEKSQVERACDVEKRVDLEAAVIAVFQALGHDALRNADPARKLSLRFFASDGADLLCERQPYQRAQVRIAIVFIAERLKLFQ